MSAGSAKHEVQKQKTDCLTLKFGILYKWETNFKKYFGVQNM